MDSSLLQLCGHKPHATFALRHTEPTLYFYTLALILISVMDTTGADDNFHGAFLCCLTQKWDLDRTLRLCNAFSSLTCQGLGGLAAASTLEETLQKMVERA